MEFIKKNIKLIMGILVGMTLVSSLSVYATYNYLASDIGYTKPDGTKINVQDALSELYSKDTNVTTVYFLVWSGVNNGFYYKDYQNFKYFRINQTDTGTSTGITIIKYNWSNGGETTTLSLNTKYEITTNHEQIVVLPNSGYRNIKIEFF